MATKRKRGVSSNSSPLRTHWRVDDVEELLGYLDYGVNEHLSTHEINEGAAKQVALHSGLTLSAKQIAAKLRSLWNEWGDPMAKKSDFARVYKEGSACLRYFKNEEQANRVRLRADELKAQALHRAEQEQYDRLATPRTLRSASTPRTTRQVGMRLTRSAQQTLTPSPSEQWEAHLRTPSRVKRHKPAAHDSKVSRSLRHKPAPLTDGNCSPRYLRAGHTMISS